ncbi:hypothetical protein [uncultured Tateyamaria sp.]|uniref:hypothetical protein n=1 Tax=uncultured Tateyamaria sp. TaxID=455651 RepID=UPI00261B3806|nr:hypothetical protein [uncultured Tateyamaria sp.]
MKKFATLLALVPGMSFAHGGHAPLPDTVHNVSHTGPVLGATLIIGTIAVLAYQRWKS